MNAIQQFSLVVMEVIELCLERALVNSVGLR